MASVLTSLWRAVKKLSGFFFFIQIANDRRAQSTRLPGLGAMVLVKAMGFLEVKLKTKSHQAGPPGHQAHDNQVLGDLLTPPAH